VSHTAAEDLINSQSGMAMVNGMLNARCRL